MNCKILIVDTTTSIRSPWKKVISTNFVTVEAIGGFEAVTKIKQNKFDLVIINISLTNLNGVDAIGKIREKYTDLPIIVIYDKRDTLNLKQAKIYGIQQVVTLPVDIKVLLSAIIRSIPSNKIHESENSDENYGIEKKEGFVKKESHVDLETKFYEGLSAIASNQIDKAIEIYKYLLSLTNIKHEAWLRYREEAMFQLGQCYARLKDYPRSNKYYSDFISKAPYHNCVKEALLFLGRNYESLNKLQKASYYFKKVLNTPPFDSFSTQARKMLRKIAKAS